MNTQYSVIDCVSLNIPTLTDERGTISVMDKELPFPVKRIFWLYQISKGKERGGHALLNSSEIIVAIHGSFVVDLDDSVNETSILLDSPDKGLIILPGIWFLIHSYKNDGVSLILAEEEYAQDKYIYNYEEFKKMRSI